MEDVGRRGRHVRVVVALALVLVMSTALLQPARSEPVGATGATVGSWLTIAQVSQPFTPANKAFLVTVTVESQCTHQVWAPPDWEVWLIDWWISVVIPWPSGTGVHTGNCSAVEVALSYLRPDGSVGIAGQRRLTAAGGTATFSIPAYAVQKGSAVRFAITAQQRRHASTCVHVDHPLDCKKWYYSDGATVWGSSRAPWSGWYETPVGRFR